MSAVINREGPRPLPTFDAADWLRQWDEAGGIIALTSGGLMLAHAPLPAREQVWRQEALRVTLFFAHDDAVDAVAALLLARREGRA